MALVQPASARVRARIGVMTAKGRSVPLPWLVVKVICQLLNLSIESAR